MNPTGKLLLAALLLCIILDSVFIHGVAEGMDRNAMRIETWEIDRHGTIYAYVPEILPEDRIFLRPKTISNRLEKSVSYSTFSENLPVANVCITDYTSSCK